MDRQFLSLAEVQIESTKVLKAIDKICSDNGFRYFLAYGTLLGAVRHQNVIPWDDDVDIWMPRPDYDKFIDYCCSHSKDIYPLEILSPLKKEYPYVISRLSNSNYVLEEENVKPYGLGIFVDIYPLDGVGSNYEKALSLKRKVSKYISLCYLSTRTKFTVGRTKKLLYKFVKFPAYLLSRAIGKDYFINKILKIAAVQNYSSSKFIGCLVWGSNGVYSIFNKEDFDNPVKLKLGDGYYCAPSNYDKILKLIYNDYMKIPPEEDRIGYHFARAYLKNKDIK